VEKSRRQLFVTEELTFHGYTGIAHIFKPGAGIAPEIASRQRNNMGIRIYCTGDIARVLTVYTFCLQGAARGMNGIRRSFTFK
jgi:hypothetical protein